MALRIAPVLVLGNRNQGDFSDERLRLSALARMSSSGLPPRRGGCPAFAGHDAQQDKRTRYHSAIKSITFRRRTMQPAQGFLLLLLDCVVAVLEERATVGVDVTVVVERATVGDGTGLVCSDCCGL
jgi:hypothetical protein